VRLVVYIGAKRVPAPIFNEKVLAGLGSGLERTGRLPAEAKVKTLAALRRFKLLTDHMRVRQTRVLATAAIRDAEDGPAFVREIDRIGFDCEVLGPEKEAQLAGKGVASGIPEADGIVGDLGGGSLELVDIADGVVTGGISLPLGVLRLGEERAARGILRAALGQSGIAERSEGRNFYMVGGSWRALARIDMIATDYPLPIAQQYCMAPERAGELRRLLETVDPKWSKKISPARLATSGAAAMLLASLVDELKPSSLVLSTYGIREGLLYSALGSRVRRLDPLVEAARECGGGEHRFSQHGDLLDEWIAPLFEDRPEMRRLRLASCLLADVAWQANPAFRADRAVEMALHGNWVAVTPAGRVIMAQALSSNFGRDKLPDARLAELCTHDDLKRAREWGLAMRLGQRLSGGVAAVLGRTALDGGSGTVRLGLRKGEEALAGDAVRRRLARLADAVDRKAEIDASL